MDRMLGARMSQACWTKLAKSKELRVNYWAFPHHSPSPTAVDDVTKTVRQMLVRLWRNRNQSIVCQIVQLLSKAMLAVSQKVKM